MLNCVQNVLVGLALLLLKLKYLCYKGFMECLNFKLILWFCRIWLCCTLLHHHSGAYMFTCIISVNFEAKLILCMSINLYLWSIVLSSVSVLHSRCSTNMYLYLWRNIPVWICVRYLMHDFYDDYMEAWLHWRLLFNVEVI